MKDCLSLAHLCPLGEGQSSAPAVPIPRGLSQSSWLCQSCTACLLRMQVEGVSVRAHFGFLFVFFFNSFG